MKNYQGAVYQKNKGFITLEALENKMNNAKIKFFPNYLSVYQEHGPTREINNCTRMLHVAAKKGHGRVVEYLLEHCIDPISAKDESGKTARDIALENKKYRTVKIIDRFIEESKIFKIKLKRETDDKLNKSPSQNKNCNPKKRKKKSFEEFSLEKFSAAETEYKEREQEDLNFLLNQIRSEEEPDDFVLFQNATALSSKETDLFKITVKKKKRSEFSTPEPFFSDKELELFPGIAMKTKSEKIIYEQDAEQSDILNKKESNSIHMHNSSSIAQSLQEQLAFDDAFNRTFYERHQKESLVFRR